MLLNVEPINEVYFGKTPELQKIENQLGKFRSKYMENYIKTPLINKDPDLLKYNRMMEEYFGFGIFSLSIIEIPKVNAYTISVSGTFDTALYQKNLQVDKNHFKFNPKANYTCETFIYSGIIFNPDFTTEEVMAVIMHEVGHNFYNALSGGFGVLDKLIDTIHVLLYLMEHPEDAVATVIGRNNAIKSMEMRIKRYCREHNLIISDIFLTVEWMLNISKNIPNIAFDLLDKVTLGFFVLAAIPRSILTAITDPFTWILMPFDLNNEKTADNFCTFHGYGPALSTALNKLDSTTPSKLDKAFNNIPLLSNMYSINHSIAELILSTFDCHPDIIARIQDQLNMLKRELDKDDLDPKMRKAILADIAACEKEIKRMIKLEDGIKDPDTVTKLWDKFVYDNCKSKRLRDIIFDNRNRFNTYDKIYDEKITK